MAIHDKHTVFTKRLLHVIHLAYEEARMVNDEEIRPEHLLLGMMHEQDGMGAEIIRRLGIYEDEIRRELAMPDLNIAFAASAPSRPFMIRLLHRVGHISRRRVQRKVLALSLEARQSLCRAQQEAECLHVDFVGTEHVLFGLAQISEGKLARLFKQFQIDEKKVHAYIVRFYAHAGILA